MIQEGSDLISEKLFLLAMEYKKTKLWTQILEDQLFAVPLSGNRTGYVSIMGRLGEHNALALYIGEKGLRSYHILHTPLEGEDPELFYSPGIQNNHCLQLAFLSKEEASDEEIQTVRSYARTHNIKLTGKLAYPVLCKFEAGRMMQPLQTDQESDDLQKAIEAAIYFAQGPLITGYNLTAAESITMNSQEIVLLEKESDHYRTKLVPLPHIEPYIYPAGLTYDELAGTKIKRLKKTETWRMRLVSPFSPMPWENDEELIYPTLLVVINAKTHQQIPVRPVAYYENRTDVMLNVLMEAILDNSRCPARIEITDHFTEALLHKWCDDMGIKLTVKNDIPGLEEEIWNSIQDFYLSSNNPFFEFTAIEGILDMLLTADPEDLADMPEELQLMIREIDEELGVRIIPGAELETLQNGRINLHFIAAEMPENAIPTPREHQQVFWVRLTPKPPKRLLPADHEFWKRLAEANKND